MMAPFDALGAVDTADPAAVAGTVDRMLAARFGAAWNGDFVRGTFAHVADAYGGRLPGLLPCDTPYHDLRHVLEAALATARLVDGWEAQQEGHGRSLGAPLAMVAIVLALMHDLGLLRRPHEADRPGASLTQGHEARAIEYARAYLAASPLAGFARVARLIDVTRIGSRVEDLGGSEDELLVARMLATADLTCQLADRFYLEKCRDFLYEEFIEAGLARGPDGRNPSAPYASPEDLLRKTPGFCQTHVLARLDGELGGVHRLFAVHFGGRNPYRQAIERNLAFLEEVIASGDYGRLRRRPEALFSAGED